MPQFKGSRCHTERGKRLSLGVMRKRVFSPGVGDYGRMPGTRDYGRIVSSSSSRKPVWAGLIMVRAAGRVNQAARSISGKVRMVPELRGHSISKVLLTMAVGSR